ncbi:MAG: cyclase family protein, partial [Chloroflexi bacterium]|nr:cyclase family protein [Chloroflexota bacterium]
MFYDISRPLTPRTAVFPGDTPVSITPVMQMRHGDSCNVSSIRMSVHAGTHIDAPSHYADGAPGVDALDLNSLIGPARVVTLPEDLTGLGDLSGLRGLALIIHTRASDVPDDVFDPSFAYFTPADADWLGRQGVRLIGTDAPSVDEAASQDLPAHKMFLQHGVLIVENLCLRGVPDGDYELIALPLKIVDGDAARGMA